jgi:glycosyltransferase involved in cell wall biosynthesis
MKQISDLQMLNSTLLAEKTAAEAELQKLKDYLEQIEKKAKKQTRILLILALPLIVILSPILLLLSAARKIRRSVSAKKKARVAKKKTIPIFHAFSLRKEQGAQAALDYLRKDEAMCAMGAVDLFSAMDADSDQSWLSAINRWGGANQIPEISLTTDVGTRFSRMRFAKMSPVLSPDLVTVIIPCFNCQDSVAQSVDSILGQTWENLEIIAVNDASTDRTGAILDALASRNPRLRVLHNVLNVGPYVSKNRALQQARGSYVTGHDGDDISLPDRIERQVHSLYADTAAVATISYMVRFDEAGRFDGPTKSASRSYDGIARLCPISFMCETSVLRDVLGGWDCVRFGGDSELIDRVTLALGDTFVRDNRIAMLCLSAAAGLTNDPVHGINTPTGLSPVRRDYVASYRAWHGAATKNDLHVPFPHMPRKFDAPKEMLVPAEVLSKVLDVR